MSTGLSQEVKEGLEAEEFIIAEFGRVSLTWFDMTKKYRGSLFKLNQDAAKQCSEIAGFSANFELAAIRTALLDFVKSEAYVLFEIERNTKPTDIAVRYSRERWTLLDAVSKSGDNLRPWLKSEYKSGFISDKLKGLIAEQLKFNPENAGNFIIRINLKEKVFGLIGEEIYQEQMPTGGFSSFSLPTDAMLAVYEKYGKLSCQQNLDQEAQTPADEPDPAEEDGDGIVSAETMDNFNLEAKISEPAASADSLNQEPLPGSTKALEKFIQRKEERPEPQQDKGKEKQVESSSAKYATYSRSEVDQMLKQHSESIASALGTKISSQQRLFQESVERQEKAFAKLSDGFVNQFEQSRQRLESMSKNSEESIHKELEEFRKELAKELEQYRAQMNKSIVPVAKFIDEMNSKTPEKAQKEAAKQVQQKAAGPAPATAQADVYGLKPLLICNLVLVLVVIGSLFAVVMPDIARIQDLQKQIDSLNARLSAAASNTQNSGNISPAGEAKPVSSTGN